MAAPPRVLVADDEPDIVSYLTQVLDALGCQTVTAHDGVEALARAEADPPDLVILDVIMPRMDGFAVCRALRGREATRLVPVVIMTALDGVETRVRALEAGADDVLAKPVNHRELVARIEGALRFKDALDRRVGDLTRVRDHFAKFVPEAVRRLVLDNPETPELDKRERDVSVLFVDISGYGRLVERLAPAALNGLVERYFSSFLDRIRAAGGDINETAGDGFMAIFQDLDGGAHAGRAVETALILLAVTEALNQTEARAVLGIHLGVNSGPALVGSTRFEGRRGTRWTFTASGVVTTLAARLAAAAGEMEVLAGPETVRRVAGRYRLERIGRERLKNLAEPVEVHRIVGPAYPR